ncbi:hypothetical protein C8R46DRAFT_1094577 [Mycena filopes]|nr:hypothetical protein C8R46DRAFT_1094577 [Mycena filopes]
MVNPSQADVSNPRLPPELERVIFEFAAITHRTSIPTFMRVCWRVKQWVEPLLYEVVFVTSPFVNHVRQMQGIPVMPVEVFIHAIATKPHSFFAASVRHLFLQSYLESATVSTIFAACSSLTHLYYTPYDHDPRAHLLALESLHHLEQVAFFVTDLFPRTLDWTRPMFQHLTHLELLDTPTALALGTGMALPARLTHIALHPASVPQYTTLRTWLRSTTHGQLVCILFLVGGPVSRSRLTEVAVADDDERFMFMGQTGDRGDWLRVATGAGGYWVLAEAFITAKRRGRVHRSLRGLDQHGSLARQLLAS